MKSTAPFDRRSLPVRDRRWLANQTRKLNLSAHRAAWEILDIGTLLIQVRNRIGHGRFIAWCKAELPWSRMQTWRMMRAAKIFAEVSHAVTFEPTALYLLSQASTPQSVREYAIAESESGNKITGKMVKEILQTYRSAPKMSTSTERELAPLLPTDRQTKTPQKSLIDGVKPEWEAVRELASKCDQIHLSTINDGEEVVYSATVYRDGRPRVVVGADLSMVVLELADRLPSKECRRCKAIKPVSQFSANALLPDGKNPYCRDCEKARLKKAKAKSKAKTQHRSAA